MKVSLDTNVILDAIANREPFYVNSQRIINLILDNHIEGFITTNSTTDIYYIARKYLTQNDLRNTMHSLFNTFSIIDVLGTDCHKALGFPLNDYEDALLVICSNNAAIDYIITRDEGFLKEINSSTPVISPADFLRMIG
jgi:predicted nucleic acid-binding protein